jgi:hypothetical protein
MTSPVRSDSSPVPRQNPDAVLAEVSEGAVLYLPETEHYFGLSPVAVQVWQLLPAAPTIGALCARLAELYDGVPMDVLRADVSELLAELERMQLATPAASVT